MLAALSPTHQSYAAAHCALLPCACRAHQVAHHAPDMWPSLHLREPRKPTHVPPNQPMESTIAADRGPPPECLRSPAVPPPPQSCPAFVGHYCRRLSNPNGTLVCALDAPLGATLSTPTCAPVTCQFLRLPNITACWLEACCPDVAKPAAITHNL